MKKCTAFIVLAFCLYAFAGCTHKTKIAHGRLFHDDTFNFEALRALHYAPTEGADINEVLDTVAEIRENDFDSWTDEWTKRARMTEARGDRATDDLSKARCYARASNYYRTAEFFIDHSDPRKAELGRKSKQLFYRYLDLRKIAYERMEIPWQGKSLSANYYRSAGANRNNRLIVGLCGFDSIQEELYFIYVREALERGYDVLTYDGPGQGSSIRDKGIVFTRDWEKPNTAVIDHLIAHKGAPAKIILLGNSFGSLLGTRAAAADSRIDALICFDVFYDYGDVALWDFPQSTRTMIDEYPGKKTPWISQKISSFIMHKDPKIRWAISHAKWVMGLESEMDVLKEYTRYTIKDIAHKVNCDVLLMSCAEDHLIPAPLAGMCKNSLVNARSLTHIHYTRDSDGYLHCRVGALNALYETMFPWMDSLDVQSAKRTL